MHKLVILILGYLISQTQNTHRNTASEGRENSCNLKRTTNQGLQELSDILNTMLFSGYMKKMEF